MKWLKRKLLTWVQDARESEMMQEEEYYDETAKVPSPYRKMIRGSTVGSPGTINDGQDFHTDNPKNIRIYKLMGGHVVKFSQYDEQSDSGSETSYIIPDSDDFDQSLLKFIAIERMK